MTEEWVQRSVAGREQNPQPIDLTAHDKGILLAIHRYDGILSIDQIRRWFGYGTLRNAQRRMSDLYNHKYVHRWKGIYWLDKRGAELVAEEIAEGVPFKEFRWRDEPYASKVPHDILLNEFRHAFEEAVAQHPMLSLEFWYGQYDCLAFFPKKTEYLDHAGQHKQRRVQLDGLNGLHFSKENAKSRLMRFCIEFDNATESNVRFARDKVFPGIQFVHSAQYQEVLHTKVPARWLVVVTGPEQRYRHLRTEVTAAGGASFFLFTRAERVTVETVLTGNIWQLSFENRLLSLEEYETDVFQTLLQENTARLKLPKLL
ncbi:MAG: replication-relaxation family protein [Chloroflexota bacterium]